VELDGRTVWHFPRNHDGTYTGYYPGNGLTAIAHLESLHRRGAEYLVFPKPAFWWLEHYGQFRAYLERHCPLVFRDDETCLIFALDPAKKAAKPVSLAGLIGAAKDEPGLSAGAVAASYFDGAVPPPKQLDDLVEPRFAADLQVIFDAEHYSQ